MKGTVNNILRTVFAYGIVAALFIITLLTSLGKGNGIGTAIFSAVFVTVAVLLIIGLLFVLWWRLFTPSGRKAEEETQARSEIKKIELRRDREWREMNR